MGKGWRYYEEKVSDLRQEMAKLIASRWLCSEEELRTIVEEVQKEVLADDPFLYSQSEQALTIQTH